MALKGIFAAKVQNGPWKGWPVGAAVALNLGAAPAEVRAAMIADLENDKREIDRQIEAIKALPDPVPTGSSIAPGSIRREHFAADLAGALALSAEGER